MAGTPAHTPTIALDHVIRADIQALRRDVEAFADKYTPALDRLLARYQQLDNQLAAAHPNVDDIGQAYDFGQVLGLLRGLDTGL